MEQDEGEEVDECPERTKFVVSSKMLKLLKLAMVQPLRMTKGKPLQTSFLCLPAITMTHKGLFEYKRLPFGVPGDKWRLHLHR